MAYIEWTWTNVGDEPWTYIMRRNPWIWPAGVSLLWLPSSRWLPLRLPLRLWIRWAYGVMGSWGLSAVDRVCRGTCLLALIANPYDIPLAWLNPDIQGVAPGGGVGGQRGRRAGGPPSPLSPSPSLGTFGGCTGFMGPLAGAETSAKPRPGPETGVSDHSSAPPRWLASHARPRG